MRRERRGQRPGWFGVLVGLALGVAGWALAWPVPDSGQTISYAVGDDGYYNINPHTYTDNSDGTVTDNGTTLMWQQQDDDKARSWADANSYCEAMTIAEHADWRLPTVMELAMLVDRSKFNPAVVDKTIFPGTNTNNPYWSSSINTNLSYPVHAFHVKFNDGYVDYGDKTVGEYVRCVRGGPAQEGSKFVLNNGATATDVTTGLVWQRTDNGQAGWEQAITYCEGLSFDSFSDWRLPTINELLTITDYSYSYPSANSTVFPDTNLTYGYWSSTVRASQTSYAWYVWFEYGSVGSSNIPLGYFRCVRSGPVNGTLGALVISSPNQGAIVKDGTIHITWVDAQNIGGQVAISLSRKGGKDGTWETITESTDNDGIYDWTVAGSESVNCVLMIEPIGASDKVGYKGLFSIDAPPNSTTTMPTTTSTTTSTTTTVSTTTTIPVVDQPNSTIRIYPADGVIQDNYSMSDTVKLKTNYRDSEGFDADATALANWTSTNNLIADVGNGVNKGGAVTFNGNGEVRIFAFLNGLMDYMDFKVGSAEITKHYGNLIILAGGKSNDVNDSLTNAIQYLSNRIYQVFKVRMFKDEDIYYINNKTGQDFNGDGIDDGIVDQTVKSTQTLHQAMQWAANQVNDGPLYLYLMDHGAKNGTFLIDNNEVLSAAQLKAWLDEFETTTNGRTSVVVLEACYSGSFVEALAGPHRMIITSSSKDQFSFFNNNGTVSFGQFFSNRLMVGETWGDSFDKAVADMSSIGAPYAAMNPQKSIGSEVAMGMVYGEFTMGSLFPEIKAYTQGVSVNANAAQSFGVQLGVMDAAGVEVWAMVTPPNYQPPTVNEDFRTPALNLDTIILTSVDGSLNYNGSFTFTTNGNYSVTYYVKDGNGMVASTPPQTFTVSGGVEVTTTTTTMPPTTTTTEASTTPSTSTTTTTTIPNNTTFPLALSKGWSLLSSTISLQTATIFADENTFTSVWKWTDNNSGVKTWAVYLPGADSVAYANSKGFISLAEIKSGEGFWVNSAAAKQVAISGPPVYGSVSLTQGWNLVGLKGTKPMAAADLGAVTSVWKWSNGNWAVNLPDAVDKGEAYALAKGFGLLTTIEPGEGFWVNAPAPVEVAGTIVTVTLAEADQTVTMAPGQTLAVTLDANPSTGYTWTVTSMPDFLQSAGDPTYISGAASGVAGAPGKQTFKFSVTATGQGTLSLSYLQPWDTETPPAKTFQVEVESK